MIQNTENYRVFSDRDSRRLVIQAAGTWAPVSEIKIPREPGLLEVVIKALSDMIEPTLKTTTKSTLPESDTKSTSKGAKLKSNKS